MLLSQEQASYKRATCRSPAFLPSSGDGAVLRYDSPCQILQDQS